MAINNTAGVTSRAAALKLYRSILRAHNMHLPPKMRHLGDAYVKSEFRLHKTVQQDSKEAKAFMEEWTAYLQQILETARARELRSTLVGVEQEHKNDSNNNEELFKFGREMPQNIALSDEQRVQLQKLKDEAAQSK